MMNTIDNQFHVPVNPIPFSKTIIKWIMTCILLFVFNVSRNRFMFFDSFLKSIYTPELFIDGIGKLGFMKIVFPFLMMIAIQGLLMGFVYGIVLYVFIKPYQVPCIPWMIMHIVTWPMINLLLFGNHIFRLEFAMIFMILGIGLMVALYAWPLWRLPTRLAWLGILIGSYGFLPVIRIVIG